MRLNPQANSEYQEVLQRLQMLTTGYNDMHREREEYEEKERKLADERLQEGLKRVRARCVWVWARAL